MAEFKLKQTAEEVQKAIDDASIPSDWNQTDETAADFIKNKPFGDELTENIPEAVVVGEDAGDGSYEILFDVSSFNSDTETLIITFDGDKFECTPNTSFGTPMFGNLKYMGLEDTGEPFLFMLSLSEFLALMIVDDAESHTVGVATATAQKIQPKYVAAVTTFYCNEDDIFLYTDSDCTTKATAPELINSTRNFAVQIASVQQGFVLSNSIPVYVKMVAPDSYTYAVIYTGEAYKCLYTAEFTS